MRRSLAAKPSKRDQKRAAALLDRADASLLEIVDHVLNKGVVLNAELLLGVADIDLIYLRLTAILCAADRIFPRAAPVRAAAKKTRRR